jgi:hypothetical protein
VEPANRRYADPLGGQWPGAATGPPLTLIGYWDGGYERGWPRIADFVDGHWDETERDRVAFYLEQGFCPEVASQSRCK